MRLLIHDFAGHPFQAQLSRRLAQRGHAVTHVYPMGLAGPKGRLTGAESDSARLNIRGIQLSSQFRKYSAHRRFVTQRKYANDLKKLMAATDGNLSVHARKLEDAAYIVCEKSFSGRMPRTEYRITAAGRKALDQYLNAMEAFIKKNRAR